MAAVGLVSVLAERTAGDDIPRFDVVFADGTTHRFGGGASPAADPRFTIRVRTWKGERALRSFDLLKVGEAYVDQDLDFEGDFLALLDMRRILTDWHPWLFLKRFLVPAFMGRVRNDKVEVTKHYDFGNDFYFAFLDRQARLYSQALFASEDETLEQAVANKLDYVVRACRLGTGSHVLDVGAGWGSFSRHAAAAGIDVTMLTIAREQFKYLGELCAGQAFPGRLQLTFESILAYQPAARYDAAVLLGVPEHVPDYDALARKLEQIVKRGGMVYMDFVAVRKKFDISSFTLRHVFPGRGSPVVLADLVAAFQRRAFEIVALHNDRRSYFLTFCHWARNLEAAAPDLVRRYGERSYRLFRLYLWAVGHCLDRDGAMESYRIVLANSLGLPSARVGLASA